MYMKLKTQATQEILGAIEIKEQHQQYHLL